MSTIDELVRERIAARNFPTTPTSVEEVRSAGLTLEDLWLPTVVARESAIAHNLERFASWCRERGVHHAPHGKTSMAPQLWQRQLDHGAWGITAATVAQARTMHEYGIERVLIANEVVDPNQAAWLARVAGETDRTYAVLVDGEGGVRALEQAATEVGSRIPVLVEIGVPGRRTGVRTVEEGLEMAHRVRASEGLLLVGVEGYEGVLPQGRAEEQVKAVTGWLARLTELARDVDTEGLFEGEEVIVTAGGSAFPDLAADALTAVGELSRPVRRLIRSGCVVTHDHRSYERSSPLRSGATSDPLRPALTAVARIHSTPEPGRALATVGKRDVPVDVDLPVLLRVSRDGGPWEPLAGLTVVELNDHHLFVDDPVSTLRVGDVVELGLSHPCTTFDKWDLVPVLDDDDRVIDAIVTLF